ncbi:serpin-ZX-like [Silene latifolia]|uniref:serpin-ZX-like n=1 Tax=Silene latifolia TaxID=37657 RepID=UPI003D775DB3
MERVDMDLPQLITNQTHVSMKIAHHVASSESTPKNSVSSPLSLHAILGLIAAGSSGSTRDELTLVLGSNSIDDVNKLFSEIVPLLFADGSKSGGPKLSFANGVWVDQSLPFKPEFKRVVQDLYKAVSSQVDFLTNAAEVASEVNSWAEKQTSGLIKDLLPSESVDETTKLIFANALYFKGAWNKAFNPSRTKEDDFHLLDGTSVKVPYMRSYEDQFIKTWDDFKVLRLPYKQGEDKRQFSMYFLLPNEKDGLLALSEKVAFEPGFLDEHLPVWEVEVGDFRVPRFKISFGFEASNILRGLGINLAFSGGGLTEMVESPEGKNLGVSSIFHKAFIEVNEEGTEAAAASVGVVSFCSLRIVEKVDFVADHPFMYLIREDTTGVVLFVGHVVNPREN